MTMTTCRKCGSEVARKEKNVRIVTLKNRGTMVAPFSCPRCSHSGFGGDSKGVLLYTRGTK